MAEASGVFRMLQHNQASVNSLAHAKNRSELFRERMDALVGLLTEQDAPLESQVRAAVALASVSFGCMFYADRTDDPERLRAIVLDIACGLSGARPVAGDRPRRGSPRRPGVTPATVRTRGSTR